MVFDEKKRESETYKSSHNQFGKKMCRKGGVEVV
jgi:hypothetical protein